MNEWKSVHSYYCQPKYCNKWCDITLFEKVFIMTIHFIIILLSSHVFFIHFLSISSFHFLSGSFISPTFCFFLPQPMLSFSVSRRPLLWCQWLCLQSFKLLWLSSVWSRGFMQEPIVMSGHWIFCIFCQWCLVPTHIWPSFLLILDVAPTSLVTGASLTTMHKGYLIKAIGRHA